MPHVTLQQLALEWEQLCARTPPEVREWVQQIANDHLQTLASDFYTEMMDDASASFFLSDELVKTRLHAAMQRWLQAIFDVARTHSYQDAVKQQQMIGEVHARIGIPAYLVMRGARSLNRSLRDLIVGQPGMHDPVVRLQALGYAADISNLAIEIMCRSYAVSHDRNARAEESYRLFAMSQNVGAEKERQRAALLDWENQLMFELAVSQQSQNLPSIQKSEFGLWFLHKAAHAFDGSTDVTAIATAMSAIDTLTQQIQNQPAATEAQTSTQRIAVLHQVREQTRTIGFLLDRIFEQVSHVESGRDTLTQLLNRKYLQVVLSREIDYARKHGLPMSVMALDVDYFKHINDTYGHEGGDAVLQQLALLITHSTRGGDYVFRLGGEEFLVVLIDVDGQRAQAIAELLRHRVETERMVLPDKRATHVTLSIGVAAHAGHPDYMRLLKAADEALYQAKKHGRNRVEMATTSGATSAALG